MGFLEHLALEVRERGRQKKGRKGPWYGRTQHKETPQRIGDRNSNLGKVPVNQRISAYGDTMPPAGQLVTERGMGCLTDFDLIGRTGG